MKRQGFDNWERAVDESIEQLRMLKLYHKPQALRTFARMFSFFLPPFYALAFAQLAHGSNSIGLGISFAIIISLGLSGRSCFQISCPA